MGSVLNQGPYERSLADTSAFAGQFYSVMHYSLPNCEAATSGIAGNLLSVTATKNMGDQAGPAGRSWGAYFENMPAPCFRNNSGAYDIYHNPFLADNDVVNNPARCDKHSVNFDAFSEGLENRTLPDYAFIAPNTPDDAHDTGGAFADEWLSVRLPTLLGSPTFASPAIFLTYDEGRTNFGANNGSGGGQIYTVLVSPFARMRYNSSVQYDTFSLLTTTEWLLGLGRTGHHDNWSVNPAMQDQLDFSPHVLVSGHAYLPGGTLAAGATISGAFTVGTPVNPATGRFELWLSNGTYSLSVAVPGRPAVPLNLTVSGSEIQHLKVLL